jgi:hypothetical protein
VKKYKGEYFFGFDYLRAICCLLVVSWHVALFGKRAEFDPKLNIFHIPTITDIAYFNISLLAVPIFVQLSLLLYVLKERNHEDIFIKRMFYVFKLYIVWPLVYMVFLILNGHDISYYYTGIKSILTTIMSTQSEYYFFFVLLLTTLLSEVGIRVITIFNSDKCFILYLLFCLSMLSLFYMPHLLALKGIHTDYWNPINFIPYVFSSLLLRNIRANNNPTKTALVLFWLYIILSIGDWLFMKFYIWKGYEGFILPTYTRASVVFGAMFFVYVFSLIKTRAPKIVKFFSEYSLGIYCLHVYPDQYIMEIINNAGLSLNFVAAVRFLSGLFFSVIVTWLYKKLIQNYTVSKKISTS